MNKFPDDLTDTELVEAAALMHTNLSGAPASYHATAAQATDLLAKSNAFAGEVTAHVAAQADARSQTQKKNQSRLELEDLMTLLVKQAKLYGASESDLGKLGVPTGAAGDAPSSATRPAGKVDTSRRLEHLIHFSDEATPDSKRRPRGVLGCEIHRKIGGAPPVDESECQFLTLDTETPYLADYAGEKAGAMAHYMLRWRLRDGSNGAWSETLSATVTG